MKIADYISPDGSIIKDFHSVITNNASVAVICNPKLDKFILLKEFRPALGGIYYTLPGGGIENTESPLNCIKREVLEELSIECINYKFIGQIINNGSYHFGEDCVFLATADIEKMSIVTNKEEYIYGFEIFDWETFILKDYKRIKISGVLSALMLAYININKEHRKQT